MNLWSLNLKVLLFSCWRRKYRQDRVTSSFNGKFNREISNLISGMIIKKLGSKDLLENREGKDVGQKRAIFGGYFKDTVSRLFVCLINSLFNTLCPIMISEYSKVDSLCPIKIAKMGGTKLLET